MNDRTYYGMTTAPSLGVSKKSESKKNANPFGVKRFERVTSDEIERNLPIARKMIELYGYGETLTYEEKLAAGLLGVAIALEKFEPARNVPKAYWIAYQIDKAIRNETRSILRQRGRAVQPYEENFDPIDENEWKTRETCDERKERKKLLDDAVEELQKLDPRSQFVVRRLCFDGKTQQEVAEELGVSQSWTSRIARAAYKKLRRELERRATANRT